MTAAVKFDQNDSDVIVVVGSGAGGGTLANELVQKGHKVVCLEAGPQITRGDFINDEVAMHERLSWSDKRTGQATWTVKAVGGTTVHWSAAATRRYGFEFRARTLYGAMDGAALIDWPLTLSELEPYYDRAESKMGVAGTHGMPHHPASNPSRLFTLGAKRLGYTRYPGNSAINSEPRDGRPACRVLGFCSSGCKSGAKWSTLYTEIPKALATGRFELRPRSMALQIPHDDAGKASGVLYSDENGNHRLQKARVVCVAGNAVETPRLLLNSASGMYPDGLANTHGNVGKYYMRNATAYVYATFEDPVNAHRSIVSPALVADEVRHDPARGFAGGYYMHVFNAGLPIVAGAVKPGAWGREVSRLIEQYDHMMGVWVCGEDMPRPEARIVLDTSQTDQYGLPIPHITPVTDHRNDAALLSHAKQRVRALFEAVDAKEIWDRGPFANSHNVGSCRMSAEARDGVCNRWGQTHDVDNLFISDGSQTTTSGAANPTLTIVALAIRQADYLDRQLRVGEL
jgi:choline dehydrogenase-like flavoprotein